ncbi:dTDP-4-dehydrorhamnose reductase [gamma proteobacterium HIMB55]|nr:dTDP-4-dehydrorhamnose reductase [gamma proteobacterium HIMB55]
MKILVLGAAGQVGSEIDAALRRVFAADRVGVLSVVNITRTDCDVGDPSAISAVIDVHQPDWVINATAYTAVDQAESEPDVAYQINAVAPKILAECCSRAGARLIHISTDYVFSGEGDEPFTEGSATQPLGVYGATKLAGEAAIEQALSAHIILRTSWVFGAQGKNFVKTILKLAATRNEVSVVADQFGAPTSARGIAGTIALIVFSMSDAMPEDNRWGIYHFSGYPFITWAGFAETVFLQATEKGLVGNTPRVIPITTAEYLTPAARPLNSRLDCSKIAAEFDISPDDWNSSLAAMLESLKAVEDA